MLGSFLADHHPKERYLARPIETHQSDFFAGIQLKRSVHEEHLLAILRLAAIKSRSEVKCFSDSAESFSPRKCLTINSIQLRRDLCADDDEFERERGFQPRANVLIQAGMALARAEDRTLLVRVGTVIIASDIHGRHVVTMDGSAERRNELAQRLKTAGCEPETGNGDWLRTGNFAVTTIKKRGSR